MNAQPQLTRSTLYLVLARGASAFILLFLGIAISRVLGATPFGVYSFITTLIFTVSFLADFGLDSLIVRQVSQEPHAGKTHLNQILGLKLATATATIILVVGMCQGIALPPVTKQLLVIYAVSLFFSSAMKTLWHYGDAFGHFGTHAALWGGEILLRAVAGMGALLVWGELSKVILGLLGAQGVGLLITWGWSRKCYGPFRPVFQMRGIRNLIRQAAPIALSSILSVLYLRLDIIFLGLYKGEAAVGIYSAAGRYVEALTIVSTSLGLTVLQRLVQERQATGLTRVPGKYVGAAIGIGGSLGGVLFLCASPLILSVYGSEFEAAVEVLRVLSLRTGFLFAIPVFSSILIAWGQERWNVFFLVLGTLVCGGCHVVLIPPYGTVGAAWAVVIAEFVLTLIYTFGLWKLRR